MKKLNYDVNKQGTLLYAASDSAQRLPKKLQNSAEKMSFFVLFLFVKVFFQYLSYRVYFFPFSTDLDKRQIFVFFDKPIQKIIITAMRSLIIH